MCNSLGTLMNSNKTRIATKKSGFYKLNCGCCLKIGETLRQFRVLLVEHLSLKKSKSYAYHLINDHHAFDHNFEILHGRALVNTMIRQK